MHIHVSDATHGLLKSKIGFCSQSMDIKGKGEMMTHIEARSRSALAGAGPRGPTRVPYVREQGPKVGTQ
jgi:hypothetical protein